MSTLRIGVVSDTHGLLRPEVLPHLAGVNAILHAGDVGNFDILNQLAQIAPVTAIRGNIDIYGPCAQLPATEMIEFGGITVYMVHSVHDLDIQPQAAGVRVVISGHSHKPHLEQRDGVMYLNPGSIGPRRFQLPISMAILHVEGTVPRAEFIDINR